MFRTDHAPSLQQGGASDAQTAKLMMQLQVLTLAPNLPVYGICFGMDMLSRTVNLLHMS